MAPLANQFQLHDFRAAVAAAEARRERHRDCLAPGADALEDVVAIRGQDGRRIAPAGQLAPIEPPDLIAKPAQQVFFVRSQEHCGSGAPEAVERHGGALAQPKRGVFALE